MANFPRVARGKVSRRTNAREGVGCLRGPLTVVVLLLLALGGGARAAVAAAAPAVPAFNGGCAELAGRVVSGLCAYHAASGTWTLATPGREVAALQALDAMAQARGRGPLRLPSGWGALGPDEQQFVLVDLTRVAHGLPPLVALVPGLDRVAVAGALAHRDPVPTGAWRRYSSASNWAGDAQPAAVLFGYLYQDGWAGASTSNLGCASPGAPGCWGHRRNVLGAYGRTGLMGAATVPASRGGLGSSAQIFVAYDGAPVAVRYVWPGAGAPAANALWPFADLALTPWAAGAVAFLTRIGAARGTGPSTFSPQSPVTLQALATLLGRVLVWPPDPAAAPPGTAAWAVGAMGHAAAHGLLPAGIAPDTALVRREAAALVLGALGLDPSGRHPLAAAVRAGLLAGLGTAGLQGGAPLTRAQAALLLLRACLLVARQGGAGPVRAAFRPSGRVLYSAGRLRLLAPSAQADPTVYWEAGPSGEAVLAASAGRWWTGRSAWTPQTPPRWAAGASAYGAASVSLWPAGSQGVGPALFRPTVAVVAFASGVQSLLPGARAWTPAPRAAATDPARAVAAALG